jgi:ATP-dependent HslUV protease, peptidase subunit HslV
MQNIMNAAADPTGWHGTTILCVRRDGHVAMAGDGQVSMGQTIVKGDARKVRRIGTASGVLAGFAGATADAFTLLERLESKLERFPGQLERACGLQSRSRVAKHQSLILASPKHATVQRH